MNNNCYESALLTNKQIANFDFVREIAQDFLNVKKIISIGEIKGGHINQTYLVKMPESEYIIQRINTNVFSSPFGMMHNVKEVTEHIRKKIIFEGGNPHRGVLNIIKTKYDQILTIKDDTYWRCMEYINNSISFQCVPSKEIFSEVGKAVGKFQMLLNDFPPNVLDETIRHFHDTKYRYQELCDAVKINRFNRNKYVQKEIDFFNKRSMFYNIIMEMIESKVIPTRVTHNDTKSSNVLIDKSTKKALCLIDLDTVMKGSLLFDYGDALRIGASTALEDEENLDNVLIDLSLIEAFTTSFLSEVQSVITLKEIENLYYGYLIMTCEVGMRFLTDYLENDIYFKTDYENHNLVRARNQIKLVQEIEKNEDNIKKIYRNIIRNLSH